MKMILKKLINTEGRDVLGNTELLQQKLICSDKEQLKKHQFLLLLTELKPNDIDIICGNDSIKKSNIIRRCVNNTGLSPRVCFACFEDLLYALGCTDYLMNTEWFCGTPVDTDKEYSVRITPYKSVNEALEQAESSDDKEKAAHIYRALADAGVPQAKTSLALEYLASENLESEREKAAVQYLEEAANEGYEPACIYLGDCAMKTGNFENASQWYGRTIGSGLNKETKNNIKFLNKIRCNNFQTILISASAAFISLIAIIVAVILGDAGIGGIIIASVCELMSIILSAAIVIYYSVYPHSNLSLMLLFQNFFWTLAIIILI